MIGEMNLKPEEVFLAQGTLRPDLIESASHLASGKAEVIKTHHNDTELIRKLRDEVLYTLTNACHLISLVHCVLLLLTMIIISRYCKRKPLSECLQQIYTEFFSDSFRKSILAPMFSVAICTGYNGLIVHLSR